MLQISNTAMVLDCSIGKLYHCNIVALENWKIGKLYQIFHPKPGAEAAGLG